MRNALELRGADGSVIPTESIYVTDTAYLLAWAISLTLLNDWVIP